MQTWVAIACVLIATTAAAQPPDPEDDASFMTLSFDRPRSIDTGADLTFAATTALANVEGRAFSRLTLNRRIAIPVRIARTILLDHPVALFMVVKGLLCDVGVKSRGEWPGRPAKAGLFLRIGCRFAAAHCPIRKLQNIMLQLPYCTAY